MPKRKVKKQPTRSEMLREKMPTKASLSKVLGVTGVSLMFAAHIIRQERILRRRVQRLTAEFEKPQVPGSNVHKALITGLLVEAKIEHEELLVMVAKAKVLKLAEKVAGKK